jgi:hypothetical protein
MKPSVRRPDALAAQQVLRTFLSIYLPHCVRFPIEIRVGTCNLLGLIL